MSTDMDKTRYIKPTMRWVWIGMDKEIADGIGVGVTGSRTNDENLPSEPSLVHEQEEWTEDTWAGGSGGGIWDKAW